MERNTKSIIIAFLALVIGFGAGYGLALSKTPPGTHTMATGMVMNDQSMGGMHGAMNDMMSGLSGKTGDEFDKTFLSEMIVHHQGAVSMAQAALSRAKHAEITDLAQKILTAQEGEITQMQEWQKEWYGN